MLLSVSNLKTYYGRFQAIKNIGIEVREGEIVTIVGPNGAGKTTLLKAISGLIRQKTGDILYKDQKIHKNEAHEIVRMGISLVPERRQVFSRLTVLDNLRLGLYSVKGLNRAEIARRIEEIYDHFPILAIRKKQYAKTLSGGEQQMLAIGRAVMSKPTLLLLDEPSIGLAPMVVKAIFETITKLNRNGTTVLFVEQNVRLALEISDRGYVMEVGKIVLSGSSADLMNDPKVKISFLGG
jgi:branched-chain amino acid transport system ATP-binding protein